MLVYQDDDERFNLGAGRTRDGKFIVMESASHITTESLGAAGQRARGASSPLISPRQDEHEYSIDHRNGLWFIRTNDRGRNFRLVTAPVATPGREHWTELIPHRDGVMIEEIDLFAGFFIACEREDGLPRLRVWRFSGDGPEAAQAGEIAFPEPAYSAQPHVNRIFDTPTFRYAYQSLVTPSFGLRVRRGHAAHPRCSSSWRFPAASTAHFTRASAFMPPRPTASRFRSRWSIAKTSASRDGIPSTSTATAPMDTRCRSASAPTGSACSIAAW